MYTIQHIKSTNILEIKNSKHSFYSKIFLDKGASLQELTLGGHEIIQDLSPIAYRDSYASSILFPFANRIKDGIYNFKGNTFQFDKNQTEEQNALHGLVYNKTFEVKDTKLSEDSAIISLEYVEKDVSRGFPYTYILRLDYIFKNSELDLKVTIVNTDAKEFPFTLGWHPYFTSSNLFESEIVINSNEKVVLGERNITTGTEAIENLDALQIKDQFLDDCWILNSDKVIFRTPKYNLQFNATGDNNFLQAYTPPRANTIALEPTTGVSDSFNNKIGLQVLKPNETYNITWSLNITNN